MAQLKAKKITVNGKEIETCTSGKLLGLNINSTGFTSHITKTVNKGIGVLAQLRRFRNLTPKLKTTLIKTLLIPVLEYPTIPICMASITQKRKLQTVLNKAIRFIHCNEEEYLNTEQLHRKYNITPLNITNYYKARRTWETIRISETEQYEELVTERDNNHTWFPKSSAIITMGEPQAIITRQT